MFEQILLVLLRFIPARAGNSESSHTYPLTLAVHPRSCGEQNSAICSAAISCGSSPLVRGTADTIVAFVLLWRFIPARAGNRLKELPYLQNLPVHPRSCGEQVTRTPIIYWRNGSSPLVRGTALKIYTYSVCIRFIPARAGNRRWWRHTRRKIPVHPRSCGEQNELLEALCLIRGSSPLVRGTDKAATWNKVKARFIPARAGNRVSRSCSGVVVPVHPRSCGEQGYSNMAQNRDIGSSPLVRGTGKPAIFAPADQRFIPARAGNSGYISVAGNGIAVHPRSCGEQNTCGC